MSSPKKTKTNLSSGESSSNLRGDRSWHRFSYERVGPDVWESFKNVKPKEPRPPARSSRSTKSQEQSMDQDPLIFQAMLKSFKNLGTGSDKAAQQMVSILKQPSFQIRNTNIQMLRNANKLGPMSHIQHVRDTPSPVNRGRRSSLAQIGGFVNPLPLMTGAVSEKANDDNDAKQRGNVSVLGVSGNAQLLADCRAAFIEMMVATADPQGDFSWTVADPRAYALLPLKLVECKDWHAFRVLMCDLRFLWRKMQENGVLSLLQAYEMVKVPLAAEGLISDRIQDYHDFVLQHVKMLQVRPNGIFQLGMGSQQGFVRKETQMLITQYEAIIEEWHDRFIQDSHTASVKKKSTSANAGIFMQRAQDGNEHRKQYVSAFETMRYVNMKTKLSAMHEQKLSVLLERLVQKVQSSRSRLLEKGLDAYMQENRAILGLDTRTLDDVQDLEQPKQFLDLAGLWDESDKVEFVTLSIYIPPKTWNNEKMRDQFESNLCNQVAEAAHAPLELIDIVEIACPEKDAKKGMYGKVLMKCMELVKGLHVTVVAGKDFPVMDQVGKSDPFVTLNLRTARTRGHTSPRRTKQMEKKPPRMALKAQQTVYQTQSRPGELNPVHPHFNESFSFLVYDLGQDLVIVCYDQDKGGKTPVGEVVLNIDDIFSQCHTYDDETFERAFQLCKPGTKKVVTYRMSDGTRTPTVLLRFKFFTHQSPSGITPHKMANDVMNQAIESNSPLRLGCIVMGPAFHDKAGAWDTVRVYLSSSYGEFHAERRYLDRFVFPALAVDCLGQRLHFRWTDLSGYGAHGVKDDIVKRLDAVDECRIRSYDKNGENTNFHFMVALVGEKRGRIVDGHDIRKLEKANALKHGKYDWALEAVKQGVSVQELEIRKGLLNDPSQSESVVCIRDPFMDDERFQTEVPKHLRSVFTETDISGRTAVGALKRNVMRVAGQSVVHYAPKYWGLREEKEGAEGQFADKSAERVELGSLEEFGLEVFERLWRHIRQRFPSSRSKSAINGYAIEHAKQVATINSYVRPLCILQGHTQRATLNELLSCANFVHNRKPVTLLAGLHGSGKSSLIAKLVWDLNAVPKQVKDDDDHEVVDLEQFNKSKDDFNTKLRPTVLGMVMMKKIFNTGEAGGGGGGGGKGKSSPARVVGRERSRSFDPLNAEDQDEFEEDDNEPSMTGEDLGKSQSTVEATEEETRAAELEVDALIKRGLSHEEILFLAQKPRVVFFCRHSSHQTSDVLAYLCSSLLRRQDAQTPSWKRFEQLIRSRVFERPLMRDDVTTPVLLILDSLKAAERDQVRAIVGALRGRARAIMTVDSESLSDLDWGAPPREGVQWKQAHVVLNGPLANAERAELLSRLFDRLGAKKKPKNLHVITLREAAGSPLYLNVVSSYIRSMCSLYQRPVALKLLQQETIDLVVHDLLPVVEKVAGEQNVRDFLEVIMQEATGRSKKDVRAILVKCGCPISEATLRQLFDAFRPFSDPVQASSGGPLSLTRCFFKEAVLRRYKKPEPLSEVGRRLQDYRVSADAQEARLNFIRFTSGVQKTRSTSGGATDEEEEEEDAQWFSDQEDGKEEKEQEAELDVANADQIVVHFGAAELLVDSLLFQKFSGALDAGLGSTRASSMDMNELIKMLRFLNLVPQHLTKTEVVKAFRSANRDHLMSRSSDSDVHELDFREFLDCMARLEEICMNRLNMMGSQHEAAAVVIQKRVRGIAARRAARRKSLAVKAKRGRKSVEDYDDEDIKKITKLQALARARGERKKQQRKQLMHQAAKAQDTIKHATGRPAVRGRLRKDGAASLVQQRIMELFDTAQEAFVYIDNDGSDSITKVEFSRGLQRLGITGGSIGKLTAMVAADGLVDVLEFLRLFAWHDVRYVDKTMAEAKLQRSIIIEKANDRMKNGLQGGKIDLENMPAMTSITRMGSGQARQSSGLESGKGSSSSATTPGSYSPPPDKDDNSLNKGLLDASCILRSPGSC